ncbi:uncharacterized protein LOC109402125 [Aedes albopictus]|uniref:Odorant receptor n=1 Tax=Aedes albopictus TaxID=7160 RepID=A0ABM1XSG3_AEDAL
MGGVRRLTNWLKYKLGTLDDESDYFRQMEWALMIAGVQLPSENPNHHKWLFCYRVAILFQCCIWCDRFFVACTEWNSPAELIGVFSFVLALVMIISRIILMRVYLKDIQKVRSYLETILNKDLTEGRVRSYRLIRRIFLVLEWLFFCDQIILYTFGVYEERQYSVPDNISRLGPRVKLAFDILICSNHIMLSSIYAAILTILNTLIMGFSTELENVVFQCNGIFERVNDQMSGTVSLNEKMATSKFWNIFRTELNMVAARHAEVIEQFATVRTLLKISFLLIFYTEIVFIGCALFYVKMLGLTMNTVIVVSYVTAILMECYWFCRLTDIVNDTNHAIGCALYNLNWPEKLRDMSNLRQEYLEIRVTMLVIMTRAQQKLGITCGGMFEMSVAAFHELMKMIYSCLMFLLSVTT